MSQILEHSSMHFKEPLQAVGQISTLTRIKTHRRPGRKTHVNPYLIPLLRSPATIDIPAPIREVDALSLDNDGAFTRGFIFSVALSVPLWGGIAGVLWAALR